MALDGISRIRIPASMLRSAAAVIIAVLMFTSFARSQVWAGAVALAQDTVQKSPHAIRGYIMLSAACISEKRCAQLIRALDAGPREMLEKNDSVLMGWAYANECVNRPDVALQYFEKARAVYESGFVVAEIGRLKARLGRPSESLADLNRAIQLQPELDLAYCYRGFWHLAASDPQAARRDFQHALNLNARSRFAAEGLRQAAAQPVRTVSDVH